MTSRRESRRITILSAALLAAALLVVGLAGLLAAACGGATGGGSAAIAAAAPKTGGTYNYPLSQDPDISDPAHWSGPAEAGSQYPVLHELYEGLVRWEEQPDGTLKTGPCLAESWSGNADASVWTVRLRRGVVFQAPVAREVTAADVVADLRYMANRDSWSSGGLSPIKGTDEYGHASPGALGVKALDRYIVRFTLKYPFSEFPDTLGQPAFWVWPDDYLRKVGLKAYGQHPVGTGPYKYLRRVPGESGDLVRDPDWWDTSGGPYIDTIHYEVIGSVPSMLLAFQKGTVDWTPLPRGQVATSRSLPQVTSGQWKAESTPQLGIGFVSVNMKDPVMGGTQGLALRQALTYGCDRQAVIDAASDGVWLLPTGLVPPGVPGARAVTEPYAYDPAKAKQLVEQTGPVTLDLGYPTGGRDLKTIAESLAATYAKIGITITPRRVGLWEYTGKLPLLVLGWAADYPSMDTFLYPLFESRFSETAFTYYANPEVDALLAEARATPDPTARVQRYAEAERLIMADAPVIPYAVYADCWLLNSRVANVTFTSMDSVDLWRAWVK